MDVESVMSSSPDSLSVYGYYEIQIEPAPFADAGVASGNGSDNADNADSGAEDGADHDDHSDLSTDFASDRSSETGDHAFGPDPLAPVYDNINAYSYMARYGPHRYHSAPQPRRLRPTAPHACPLIPEPLCCPPPTDVDCVRVSPVAGFQSADMRYGPGARTYMHKHLSEQFTAHGEEWDHDTPAAKADAEAEAEAYDCYDADGHVVDTLYPADPPDPASVDKPSTASTAHQAPADESLSPQPDDVPASHGTDSWRTSPMHADATATGPQVRKPPPVARTRLNLVALSQRYNLFFAAFRNEIHVFQPQQAPEIVRGALLVLCPQRTEAAAYVGWYHTSGMPHQVNHMITGDLGNIEILLMAYDDGDVIAYHTHHIVEYLAHPFRGHPTRSPPKPQPFFRETVGLSAWGLAIHAQSRLIAVSSNLAEVTVFAPSLCCVSRRTAIERGDFIENVPDLMSDCDPVFYPGEYGASLLKYALKARSRNWRILLPVGRSGTNIPAIAFVSDKRGKAIIVAATDINGHAIFLDIWNPNRHPLKMRLGQAKKAGVMGWGILPILKSHLLKSNIVPKRCPQVLSREHGCMNHSLNYSLVTDPSTDAFIDRPIKHYNLSLLDRIVLRDVPYTQRMLFELDCIQGDGFINSVDNGHLPWDERSSSGYASDASVARSTDRYARDCYVDDAPHERRAKSLHPLLEALVDGYNARSQPRVGDAPFKAVDLQADFSHPLIACPGTSQTWPTSTLSVMSFVRILRSPERHGSVLSISLPMNADHARPKIITPRPRLSAAISDVRENGEDVYINYEDDEDEYVNEYVNEGANNEYAHDEDTNYEDTNDEDSEDEVYNNSSSSNNEDVNEDANDEDGEDDENGVYNNNINNNSNNVNNNININNINININNNNININNNNNNNNEGVSEDANNGDGEDDVYNDEYASEYANEYFNDEYYDEGNIPAYTDDDDVAVTDDDAVFWPELEAVRQRYVIFQALSDGAQMFETDEETGLYGVDSICKFTTDEPRRDTPDMVDMSRPYSRCSMIHFIPEISLLIVGKMQGTVVLLRPLKNGSGNESRLAPMEDSARYTLHRTNYAPWMFRTEWTLPLQRDRTDEKYPRCCLLGIAVSPVPEPGADKYGLTRAMEHADDKPTSRPTRWRLIMYYMDHSILQYYIEESAAGNDVCVVCPVLDEAQRASLRRQRADPTRPVYEDGLRV